MHDKSPTGETQLLLLSPRPAAVGHGVGTAQSVGPRLGRRHPSTCGEVTPGGSKRPPRGERWPRSSPAPLQQRVVPHAITQELAALGSNSLLPDASRRGGLKPTRLGWGFNHSLVLLLPEAPRCSWGACARRVPLCRGAEGRGQCAGVARSTRQRCTHSPSGARRERRELRAAMRSAASSCCATAASGPLNVWEICQGCCASRECLFACFRSGFHKQGI